MTIVVLHKNALWVEVSNTLGGTLRRIAGNICEITTQKLAKIRNGSAAEAANVLKKPKFRFYDLMTLLNDVFEIRHLRLRFMATEICVLLVRFYFNVIFYIIRVWKGVFTVCVFKSERDHAIARKMQQVNLQYGKEAP